MGWKSLQGLCEHPTSEVAEGTRVSVWAAGLLEEERWDPLVLDETVGEEGAKILGEIEPQASVAKAHRKMVSRTL